MKERNKSKQSNRTITGKSNLYGYNYSNTKEAIPPLWKILFSRTEVLMIAVLITLVYGTRISGVSAEEKDSGFVGISQEQVDEYVSRIEQNLLALSSDNFSTRVVTSHEMVTNSRPSIKTLDITMHRSQEGYVRFDVKRAVQFLDGGEMMSLVPEVIVLKDDVGIVDEPGTRRVFRKDESYFKVKNTYYSQFADTFSQLPRFFRKLKEGGHIIGASRDKDRIKLSVLRESGTRRAEITVVLDAREGYMPVEIISYPPTIDGKVQQRDVKPGRALFKWQQKNGLWVPVSYVHEGGPGKRKKTLKSYTPNAKFAENLFDPPIEFGANLIDSRLGGERIDTRPPAPDIDDLPDQTTESSVGVEPIKTEENIEKRIQKKVVGEGKLASAEIPRKWWLKVSTLIIASAFLLAVIGLFYKLTVARKR